MIYLQTANFSKLARDYSLGAREKIRRWLSLISPLLFKHYGLEGLYLENLELDSGFRRRDE